MANRQQDSNTKPTQSVLKAKPGTKLKLPAKPMPVAPARRPLSVELPAKPRSLAARVESVLHDLEELELIAEAKKASVALRLKADAALRDRINLLRSSGATAEADRIQKEWDAL